jgi:hypothetical protein
MPPNTHNAHAAAPTSPGNHGNDHQPDNNYFRRGSVSHPGYFLGTPANTQQPSQGTNITGYINESNIPSMLQDPESVDDLLDVPSFQRPKITDRKNQ